MHPETWFATNAHVLVQTKRLIVAELVSDPHPPRAVCGVYFRAPVSNEKRISVFFLGDGDVSFQCKALPLTGSMRAGGGISGPRRVQVDVAGKQEHLQDENGDGGWRGANRHGPGRVEVRGGPRHRHSHSPGKLFNGSEYIRRLRWVGPLVHSHKGHTCECRFCCV